MSVMITEHIRRKPDGATYCACKLPITTGERYRKRIMLQCDFADRDWILDMAHAECAGSSEWWELTEERTRRRDAKAQQLVDARDTWNARHPIGTPVRYWPGVREGDGREGVTRSEAWLVCGHASVLVSTYTGGIALTHVEVV
jgi:hypothetical protein